MCFLLTNCADQVKCFKADQLDSFYTHSGPESTLGMRLNPLAPIMAEMLTCRRFASVATPYSKTPLTTTIKDANLRLVKHISSPPLLPQNISDVKKNTRTACKPFIMPADTAPPGKCARV